MFLGLMSLGHINEVQAHATLQTENPSSNSVVQNQPDNIELTFNEPVYTKHTTLNVYDDKGQKVAMLKPNESGQSKIVTFNAKDIERGTYAIEWETVSLDGHQIDGKYQFSVGERTADGISTQAPFYTQVDFWLGLSRFILQSGLLLLFGYYIVNRLVSLGGVPTYGSIAKSRGILSILMMIAIATGILYLMSLPNDVITEILTLEFATWRQFPFVISIVVILILLILFVLRDMEWIWYDFIAILIFLGLAMSGHAWAQSTPIYSIIIRAIHLMGIAIWLGSIVYLIKYLMKQPKHSYVLILKDTIFKLNLTAVASIIVTGILMSIDATSFSAILTKATPYTFLWLSKMVVTFTMMAMGAYQTFIVMNKERDIRKPMLYGELILGIGLICVGVIMSQIEIPL
ncbi:hypothetical protein HHH54_01735 [Staphylococcus sp. H16/1A]|uniref:CopC domain-containing protein n=2 Tax=Staphylococcus canis TaxID=2724942 RepID=A0ABS0T8N0_9STAP|nr:hypothetical protein [Staphylococcus canis]